MKSFLARRRRGDPRFLIHAGDVTLQQWFQRGLSDDVTGDDGSYETQKSGFRTSTILGCFLKYEFHTFQFPTNHRVARRRRFLVFARGTVVHLLEEEDDDDGTSNVEKYDCGQDTTFSRGDCCI